MNRRSFFKALLALPVVAALAPLLPKVLPGALREEDLWAAKSRLVAEWGPFKLEPSAFVHREDISELLFAQLKLDNSVAGQLDVYSSPLVTKDLVYLLDRDRIYVAPPVAWIEDA